MRRETSIGAMKALTERKINSEMEEKILENELRIKMRRRKRTDKRKN